MEPLAARKVMPCFDEPKFKANFSMTIEAEKIYPVVLWNMPVKKEVDVDSNWKKYTFDTSVKMSTYLLAFIVADFKCTDPPLKTTNGVEVNCHCTGSDLMYLIDPPDGFSCLPIMELCCH